MMSEDPPRYGLPDALPFTPAYADVVSRIRQRVREFREQRGLSEIDLAERSELPALRVMAIEGGVGLVQSEELLALARGLAVPVRAFFEDRRRPV